MEEPEAFSLQALYRAYNKVKKGKRGRIKPLRFALNPLTGLSMLRNSLTDGNFQMGEYTQFNVYRPKPREVKASSFHDKIVLSSMCKNVLWPDIEPALIFDNYASRDGKGTHLAIDRLEENLRDYYRHYGPNGWVLKIDARKYFFNLRHEQIRQDFREVVVDDRYDAALDEIIQSSVHHRDLEGRAVGLPIGNETSQAFAVLYLNRIDHLIKDQFGEKYYGRYMDDSVIVNHSKKRLEWVLNVLREQYGAIGLELNEKTQIQPLKNGVKFLGMHLYLTKTGKVVRRLKPENVRYQRIHLRENAALVAEGKMTEESYWKRFEAWDNHASYADAAHLRRKMYAYAKEALKNAYDYSERRKLGNGTLHAGDGTGGQN